MFRAGRFIRWLQGYVRSLDWGAFVGTALAVFFVLAVATPLLKIAFGLQCEGLKAQKGYECGHSVIEGLFLGIGAWVHTYSTEVAAISTVTIAIFTITLWYATSGQLREVRAQLNLARDEFFAIHKPKLRVRSVHIIIGNDGNPAIQFTIVNSGAATGTILRIQAHSIFIADAIRPVPPFYGDVVSDREVRIPPGTFWDCIVSGLDANWSNSPVRLHGMELHFLGRVIYCDENRRTYAVGFCQRWEQTKMRFAPIVDPEYEYEE